MIYFIKYYIYRIMCNITFGRIREFFRTQKYNTKSERNNILKIKTLFKNFKPITYPHSYQQNFILFDYYFPKIYKLYGVNLGDFIQTIAVKNIVSTLYPSINIINYDREHLSLYDGVKAYTIMQGWFAHDTNFIPNNNILPIYIGTHLSENMRNFISNLKRYKPKYLKNKTIGCRDLNTLEFLQTLGVDAYFSRCLTLTFPKRKIVNGQNKVFIVNLPEQYHKFIPIGILKDAEIINQRHIDVGYESKEYLNTHKYLNKAEKLLNKYSKEAKLVITTLLHCASPCIAMGIPVVLIRPEITDERFSVLDGIIKIYNYDDLKSGNINYDLKAPNIENLKKLMLRNVELSVKQAFNEDVNLQELINVRENISNYKSND